MSNTQHMTHNSRYNSQQTLIISFIPEPIHFFRIIYHGKICHHYRHHKSILCCFWQLFIIDEYCTITFSYNVDQYIQLLLWQMRVWWYRLKQVSYATPGLSFPRRCSCHNIHQSSEIVLWLNNSLILIWLPCRQFRW